MMSKNVVISGCSSGIGKSLAKKFHAEGYEVFAGARRLEAMQDLAELGIHTYQLDVTKQDSIDKFRDAIEPLTGGKLVYLFNNAGQPLDLDIDRVEACFAVNYFGVVRMTKTFGPWVIAAKGKIIQTGSVASVCPFPFGSTYSASKAALQSYSAVLRMELMPFGVDVMTILSGAVGTNIGNGVELVLPADSLFADAEEALEARKNVSKNNEPMDSDIYAREVFKLVTPKSIPEIAWLGSRSFMSWFSSQWLPRSVMVQYLWKQFKMQPFYDRVQAKTPASR